MATLRRRWEPAWGFYVLGVAFVGIGVWHLLSEGEQVGTVLESLIVLSLALLPFYTGYELTRQDISAAGRQRAVDLTLGLVVVFALLAVAIALIWSLEGTPPDDAAFMVRFAGALGAGIGSQAALASVRSDEEYERAQQLNSLLKVTQRVLRHNLRNELAIALGHLDNLEREQGASDDIDAARRHLEKLLANSEQARRIVDVWETDDEMTVDVRALVTERCDRVRDRHPGADITVRVADDCRAAVHPAFGDAFEELVTNAVKHNPTDVAVTVAAVRSRRSVFLEVADTGVGLARGDREAVFLSEETPLSHGRGLGLVFAYWTVTESGGELSFAERDDGGTVVRVRLDAAG